MSEPNKYNITEGEMDFIVYLASDVKMAHDAGIENARIKKLFELVMNKTTVKRQQKRAGGG